MSIALDTAQDNFNHLTSAEKREFIALLRKIRGASFPEEKQELVFQAGKDRSLNYQLAVDAARALSPNDQYELSSYVEIALVKETFVKLTPGERKRLLSNLPEIKLCFNSSSFANVTGGLSEGQRPEYLTAIRAIASVSPSQYRNLDAFLASPETAAGEVTGTSWVETHANRSEEGQGRSA